ncbi:unnamed protein product [Schistocephalus solidus]|uniref:Deacetylase sirtuin-type domain-containing protein n=1 Tax=Schistocephalus solidus TaxID=70667 RepID=A0A3P7EYH9_SCHSO|nr:unnamed protein product [Schistocephalus solidus]
MQPPNGTKVYSVRILKENLSLEKAKNLEKKSEETDDLSTSEPTVLGRGYRRKSNQVNFLSRDVCLITTDAQPLDFIIAAESVIHEALITEEIRNLLRQRIYSWLMSPNKAIRSGKRKTMHSERWSVVLAAYKGRSIAILKKEDYFNKVDAPFGNRIVYIAQKDKTTKLLVGIINKDLANLRKVCIDTYVHTSITRAGTCKRLRSLEKYQPSVAGTSVNLSGDVSTILGHLVFIGALHHRITINTRFGISVRPKMDMPAFRGILSKARKLLVVTGAGISVESGVPTFRGEGGFWRKYASKDLATPEAFAKNPSLVWEFYHYRRELVKTKSPNAGHKALAELEQLFITANRSFLLATQNVDGLHERAGSKNLVELHG